MAEKFIKKPVVIEAMPFDGSWESAKPILDWIVENNAFDLSGPTWFDRADGELRIHTLEGTLSASAGDWIIRGIKGEFYPCKPDIFKETYEPAFTDAQDACVAVAAPALPTEYHIVFDGFPSPNGPRFIELEDQNGHSLGIGAWQKREDGHAELVLPSAPAPITTVKLRCDRLEDLRLAALAIRTYMPDTLPAGDDGKIHFARALAEAAADAIEAALAATEVQNDD